MRLRISKRDKNNVSPATEKRLPNLSDINLTNTEREILQSLADDYPKYYSSFQWYPEADLVDVLKNIFNNQDEITEGHIDNGLKNTLVLGRPGWGKTEAIDTLAKDLGIKYASIKLPNSESSDLVGIPKINNFDKNVDITMFDGHESWQTLPENKKKELEKEIDNSFPNVTHAPPKWMVDALKAGFVHGKKTIWFFDEINIADSRVISSAFTTINDMVIPDTNISLVSHVILIAAGNFSSDNDDVKALSDPAMERFPNKIAIAEDWNSGLKAALGAWKKVNEGLDQNVVHIVDMIMEDPDLLKTVQTINDTLSSNRMTRKSSDGWKSNLSPRWFTRHLIKGIYSAVKAYSKTKDPATISMIFEGQGATPGYTMPRELETYLTKKIQNITAPATTGTSTGQDLQLLKEATVQGIAWVNEGAIPKEEHPQKMRQVFLGDTQEDLNSIIATLKTQDKFKTVGREGWDAIASGIQPYLQNFVTTKLNLTP